MARKKRVVEARKRASSPLAASLSDEEEADRTDIETSQNDTDEEDPRGAEDEEEINPSTAAKAKNWDGGSESEDASESTPASPPLSEYTIKAITPKPEAEKAKRKEASSSSTPNGGAIQRVWSEDDEIELLKGMVRSRSEKGMDPNLVMNVFHEFIKGSFSVEITKNQLVSKIKRLKKKYFANLAKAANGKNLLVTNPHEMKAFELSNKVWGDGGSNAPTVRVKVLSPTAADADRSVTLALPCGGAETFGLGKIKERKMKPLSHVVKLNVEEFDMLEDDDAEGDVGEDSWETEFPFLGEGLEMEGLTEGVKETVRKRMREADKVVLGKLQVLESKWKKLKKAELELFVRRTELVAEQVNLVLNIIKSE